jgi:hypothetical protein
MNLLNLQFKFPLRHADLSAFRGAFAALAGRENDLFHNHDNSPEGGGAHKQRYPLIQYRVHDGNAAVLGINEGAEALDELARSGRLRDFNIQGQALPLEVLSRNKEGGFRVDVLPDGQVQRYRIYHYIPFSPENYLAYKALGSLVEKVGMLERLLQNHIVAMAHSTGSPLPEAPQVRVVLQDIDRVKKAKVMHNAMMAFDMVFSANILLPEGIGIGRKVAFGFGFCIEL